MEIHESSRIRKPGVRDCYALKRGYDKGFLLISDQDIETLVAARDLMEEIAELMAGELEIETEIDQDPGHRKWFRQQFSDDF